MKTYVDVKSFEIDRSKWLRGIGSSYSCLLNGPSGKMCCLGFYAKACGLNDDDIVNVPSPVGINNAIDWQTSLLVKGKHSGLCLNIIVTNDDTNMSSDAREKELTYLFAKIGIQVTFK